MVIPKEKIKKGYDQGESSSIMGQPKKLMETRIPKSQKVDFTLNLRSLTKKKILRQVDTRDSKKEIIIGCQFIG